MGENLAAEGRLAVRTPMQWTGRTQRRVLDGAARRDCAGPVVEGGFAPEHVNVADQRRDPDSLLQLHDAARSGATASAPSSAGATFEVLDQPHPRCSPTVRRGTTRSWSRCTTWPPSR